jgi:hypothetical protein
MEPRGNAKADGKKRVDAEYDRKVLRAQHE